ncbi:MAG: UvrD-helicase domain-containing protein [Pseudomonadota bacterium]|nr:UvrD-helicase domain-containing protein [Pseudomonadota bacterium]
MLRKKYTPNFSDEQLAVITVDDQFKILFVIAYAGAGKTTVLVEHTLRRMRTKFLYLAFNKSIASEADSKFKDNTTVMTIHSLAYRAVGRFFQHKMADNLTPGQISDFVASITNHKEGALYMFSYACVRTLNNYMANAEIDISGDHINEDDLDFIYNISSVDEVLDVCTTLWNIMCDANDDRVKMVHDGYLKLYQLTDPLLDYDCILVDEAQDSNPVILYILSRQRARLIMVGDPHQSIYAFRGAVNAFSMLEPSKVLYLTASWRFGTNVARIANEVLARKAIKVPPVRGLGEDFIVDQDELIYGREPYMDISRSAVGLFSVMAETERLLAESSMAKDYHFVGGVNGYDFDRFVCAYNLYTNQLNKIRSPDLKMFGSWGDMKRTAEMSNNPQLITMVNIVERYRKSILGMVYSFKNRHEKASNADIFLTSCHKSKGLEHNNIIVRPDFERRGRISPCDGSPESIALDQELNALYVASTRAQKRIAIARSPLRDSFEWLN